MNGCCETCRHWQPTIRRERRIATDRPVTWDAARAQWVYPYETYEYTEPPEHEGWRRCARLSDAAAPIVTIGYEEQIIETAPTFGCVLWEP